MHCEPDVCKREAAQAQQQLLPRRRSATLDPARTGSSSAGLAVSPLRLGARTSSTAAAPLGTFASPAEREQAEAYFSDLLSYRRAPCPGHVAATPLGIFATTADREQAEGSTYATCCPTGTLFEPKKEGLCSCWARRDVCMEGHNRCS